MTLINIQVPHSHNQKPLPQPAAQNLIIPEHVVLISPVPVSSASASVSAGTQFESTPAPDHPLLESSFPSDFYNYVSHAGSLRDSEKFCGLQDHFRPTKLFSFPNHLEYGKQRAFRFCWLEEHNWLAFSLSQDGAYCKF